MKTIHMEIEQARSIARSLDQAALELASHKQSLQTAGGRLSMAWSGPNASRYQRDFQNFNARLNTATQNLYMLAGRLRREIDEWEAVDRDRPFGRWHEEQTIWGGIGAAVGLGKFVHDLDAADQVLRNIHKGESMGEIHFTGPNAVREAAGLHKQLRHIDAENFARHLGRQSKVDGLDVVAAGLEFAHKGVEDWHRYESGSDKAAALTYDAAFVTAKTVGKPVFQNWFMGVAGTAILGAVAAAGAPVVLTVGVGFALWWGSGFLFDKGADLIYDWADSSGVKDAAVHGLGNIYEGVANGITSAAKATASAVDKAFNSTIKGICSLF